MPKALSLDLRERIVAACEKGGETLDEIATRFAVGRASVVRLKRLHNEKGSVAPKEYVPGPEPKIAGEGIEILRSLVREGPDQTEDELAEAFAQRTGLLVSRSSVNRALRRLGITHKKRQSLHRNEMRNAFNGSARDF